MVDLGVPLRDWRGWEEFGQFSLADIPWYRRFVWSIRLMWRYGREVRALMKWSRKRGPVPPSTG